MKPLHPRVAEVTERIRQRSAPLRGAYLGRIDRMLKRAKPHPR